jgi:hypothetical protein
MNIHDTGSLQIICSGNRHPKRPTCLKIRHFYQNSVLFQSNSSHFPVIISPSHFPVTTLTSSHSQLNPISLFHSSSSRCSNHDRFTSQTVTHSSQMSNSPFIFLITRPIHHNWTEFAFTCLNIEKSLSMTIFHSYLGVSGLTLALD